MVRYIATVAVCLSEILQKLFVNKRLSGKEISAFKREESTYMLFRDMVDDIVGIDIIAKYSQILSLRYNVHVVIYKRCCHSFLEQ